MNKNLINRLRAGPKSKITHCVDQLFNNLTARALQIAKVSTIIYPSLRRSIVDVGSNFPHDQNLLRLLDQFPEETRKELQRVFAGGFQLALFNDGSTRAWILRWEATDNVHDETILVDFNTSGILEQRNNEMIGTLRLGNRIMIPTYVDCLFRELIRNALKLTESVSSEGFEQHICDMGCRNSAANNTQCLLTLLNTYPNETREELRRVFDGFQLLLKQKECPTWRLNWNPRENDSEFTVLVDFPSDTLFDTP